MLEGSSILFPKRTGKWFARSEIRGWSVWAPSVWAPSIWPPPGRWLARSEIRSWSVWAPVLFRVARLQGVILVLLRNPSRKSRSRTSKRLNDQVPKAEFDVKQQRTSAPKARRAKTDEPEPPKVEQASSVQSERRAILQHCNGLPTVLITKRPGEDKYYSSIANWNTG